MLALIRQFKALKAVLMASNGYPLARLTRWQSVAFSPQKYYVKLFLRNKCGFWVFDHSDFENQFNPIFEL